MEKQTLPNSIRVLALGILSILMVCCCSIFSIIPAIIGLVLANRATRLYLENPDEYKGFENIKAGKILSIVGIVLGVLTFAYSFYQIQQSGGWDAYLESIRDIIEQNRGDY